MSDQKKNIRIVKAKEKDAEALTSLTQLSKAYWGYSKKQLAQWKAELTLTEDYLTENSAFILLDAETILGYYSFILHQNSIELDNLFVHPTFIGKGYGRILLSHCIKTAGELGISSILTYSDPNAEAFYAKQGFQTIRLEKTSDANRFLPVMMREF